jgi:hypothetical protein
MKLNHRYALKQGPFKSCFSTLPIIKRINGFNIFSLLKARRENIGGWRYDIIV